MTDLIINQSFGKRIFAYIMNCPFAKIKFLITFIFQRNHFKTFLMGVLAELEYI